MQCEALRFVVTGASVALVGAMTPALAAAAGGGSSGYVSDAPIPWKMSTAPDGGHVIHLIDRARERLGLALAEVTTSGNVTTTAEDIQTSIPYQALIYWSDGSTWVYAVTEDGGYRRAPVTVGEIEGAVVFLTGGPPVGTVIVTYGAAELFGVENGIGH